MKKEDTFLNLLQGGIILFLGFYFLDISQNPAEWHFLDNVNLVFHEAGHAIIFFLGDFMFVLGGTIMQILVPASVAYYFYIRKQHFSASVILFWMGHSLINVSLYAGDAIVMQLPLLGGGGHDWNYLLSTLGILEYTPIVSKIFYLTGMGVYFLAMGFGLYVVAQKMQDKTSTFVRS
jgi:hypothetical protein